MNLSSIAAWMGQSWLGQAAREVFWVFPVTEMFHFLGLCLLMGAMLVVDLRLLGFARQVSIKQTLKFIPAAGIGLAMNVLSGMVFLCAYPENYWPSTAFRFKLLAIAIGGLNALWFKQFEGPRIEVLADDADADLRAKIVAALSLFVWLVVIVLGRLLPYVSKSSS